MDKQRHTTVIVLIVIFMAILVGHNHAPWVSILGGIGLIVCGIQVWLTMKKSNDSDKGK